MPDERLLELARQGTAARARHAARGSAPHAGTIPKALAFADSFPRQWLQLRRVGMFPPDKKLYPDYDEYLEKSMVGETDRVFPRGAATHNLSLREFLDSDWTMLNERLAGHYGIAGVAGRSPAARRPASRTIIAAACSRRRRS